MNRTIYGIWRRSAVLAAALLLGIMIPAAQAGIVGMLPTQLDGSGNPVFHLTARCDFITTADGAQILIWGYAPGMPADGKPAQYPGPTLIVGEGELVTVIVHNQITDEAGNLLDGIANPKRVNVSAIFPGQRMWNENAAAYVGVPGFVTREAQPGDQVRYRFRANNPGTFLYHSGTQMDLQVELGLFGAIIVRPALGNNYAYNRADSQFEREHLFLLSEMDPRIHDLVEWEQWDQIDQTDYFPVYWFINGRTAPDTFANDGVSWLPTQPYSCFPRAMPGERLLMRVVGAGRDLHPFHHHGNHARVIGKDGRALETSTGGDLSYEEFTIQSIPGETVDAIFTWTGEKLGWDIYGHAPTDPLQPNEYAPDHGVPIPTVLPDNLDLTLGGFWSGSPFLGSAGGLPPGEGGLNPNAGLAFMWHSHTEKELTNFDIFPGGMMSMFLVEPPGTFTGPETPAIPR